MEADRRIGLFSLAARLRQMIRSIRYNVTLPEGVNARKANRIRPVARMILPHSVAIPENVTQKCAFPVIPSAARNGKGPIKSSVTDVLVVVFANPMTYSGS